MKILFSTGSLYFLPIRDVFELAAQAGFDGCDLVIDGKFGSKAYLDAIRDCSRILPVSSIHAPFARIPGWGDTVAQLKRTVAVAKELNADVVNFHPPSWFSKEFSFIRWFRKVDDFRKELDSGEVALAIENMPRVGTKLMLAPYVLNDFEDLIRFGLKRDLCFTFDTTHLATFEEDVVAGFLAFFRTGRLRNIHFSDYGATKSHLFPGRGDLPVVKLLNVMRRLGYDELLTLELAPNEWPRTRQWLEKLLAYSVTFLRMHLGMA